VHLVAFIIRIQVECVRRSIIHEWARKRVYSAHSLGSLGRVCVVSIATRYGLDGMGIESQWEARFSAPVQTGPGGPPSLLHNGYWVSFPGVKWPGAWLWPSTSSSAVVKERVHLYPYSPSGSSGPALAWTLICNKNSSLVILVPSHYSSTWSPPQLSSLSYGGTSFSVPCWQKSVSCMISHGFTNVSVSRSAVNLMPRRVYFDAENRWRSLGEEFTWYNRNRCRFVSFEIKDTVKLFCDRESYSVQGA
jgi:hypothetical protein